MSKKVPAIVYDELVCVLYLNNVKMLTSRR